MAATLFSLRGKLPTVAAGTTGAGMSFTFCAGMSFSIVVPQVSHSG